MRAFLRGFAVGLLPNLSFLAKAPNACFFDNLGYPLLRSELGVEVEKFETIALMIIASVSVLLVLKPVRCQAQAEVAPDHYNETGIEPITLPGNAIPANLKSGHLGGSFTLPFLVKYAGFTLMPGRYSLSVRSLGKWDLVTLMRQGNAARIQVRMKFRPESDRPSALFLQRAGEQRELTAISLPEPRIVLYLEAGQTPTRLDDTEVVPISYTTRSVAGTEAIRVCFRTKNVSNEAIARRGPKRWCSVRLRLFEVLLLPCSPPSTSAHELELRT